MTDSTLRTAAAASSTFRAAFGRDPVVAWAPGRVNLIGDHVDYCGGLVLPMPIQFGTAAAVAPNEMGRVRATSLQPHPPVEFDATDPPELPAGHWARFVRGALAVAELRGGWDVVVNGDVPGSGLSSSASLSVALLAALGRASGRTFAGIDLARAAQRIEHDWVGVACGLMDQAVIALGEAGAALLFDCAGESGRAVRLPAGGPAVVVFDTGRSRTLAASAYNARFDETGRAATALGVAHRRLARIDPGAVEALGDQLLRRRARHVVSEQARVAQAVRAVEAGDWATAGALLDASHASLRDDFDVSCGELDVAVAVLREHPDCLGARMTGGGFGGCAVALWRAPPRAAVLETLCARYRARTGLTPRALVARSHGGVRAL